ncbi:sensor histidine kinase [Senegalia massiliensis]|uniref:histidine kinase n=1 Tax=Senegalia massiliensis TaxID=1720316 RepID=A0A845QWM8_9CLOT|nr:ATP-binding protein [Senegalia massiliensis]NBI06189.1 HAMP domain-containing protein [Senegalia massiliensis]
MKNSIRYKLFGVFLVILTLFIVIFLISSFFLDDIFIFENKRIMKNAYNRFDTTLQNRNITENDLIELVETIGGNITILSPNLNLQITTSRYEENDLSNIDILEQIEYLRLKKGKNFTSVVSENINNNDKSMFFIGELSSGGFFIGQKAIKEIEKSAQIARLFLVIASIGTLLIGTAIVYFLSQKLTKPIMEINNVAGEISKLNFNKKVEVKSDDEIGILGTNINHISKKLNTVLTELTLANSKLREDIEKEKELEKMRRKFVSNVSHELKTPISMIAGYIEGLKYNIAKTKEDKEYYYDVIIDETDKMNNLINDLLTLSSYESGNFSINKENIDISNLLKNIIDKYRRNIEEKNLDLIIDIPERLIISADSLRIEQIITNFMNNALKYGKEGGNIKITLEDLTDKIKLSFYNSGDKIDEKELENIWTSFYKADLDKKHINSGTGLGLAIVRAIVELHGGSYGAINKKDGVKFFVALPKQTYLV